MAARILIVDKDYPVPLWSGGTVTPKKKQLGGWGDSLMYQHAASLNFKSQFEQLVLRLQLAAKGISWFQIGHPGESINDFLYGGNSAARKAEFEAALDKTREITIDISLLTNDINQFYIGTLKQHIRALIAFLKSVGVKNVVWNQVAACQSQYAYAIAQDGSIIGGNDVAAQRAGYEQVRRSLNEEFLPSLVVSGELAALALLQDWDNVYEQAKALDPNYFFQAGQGPFVSSFGEPGRVHWNEATGAYVCEAVAKVTAPLLGLPYTAIVPADPGATYTATYATTPADYAAKCGAGTSGPSVTGTGSSNESQAKADAAAKANALMAIVCEVPDPSIAAMTGNQYVTITRNKVVTATGVGGLGSGEAGAAVSPKALYGIGSGYFIVRIMDTGNSAFVVGLSVARSTADNYFGADAAVYGDAADTLRTIAVGNFQMPDSTPKHPFIGDKLRFERTSATSVQFYAADGQPAYGPPMTVPSGPLALDLSMGEGVTIECYYGEGDWH